MIKNFTIYSFQTGEILRSGSCPESMLGLQVREGESILVGLAGDSVNQIVHDDGQGNKVLITLPPLEIPEPTEGEIRAQYIRTAQRHMDVFSKTWGYDDIRSAVSYVGDPYPRFDAEGTALRNWRSEVWAYLDANQTLPDPLPTQAEFIALLPPPPVRPA